MPQQNLVLELNTDDIVQRIPEMATAPKVACQAVAWWIMGYSPDTIARIMSRKTADVEMAIKKYDPDGELKGDQQFANLQAQRNVQMLRDHCIMRTMQAIDPDNGLIIQRKDLSKLAGRWRINANKLGSADKATALAMKECAGDLDALMDGAVVGNPQYFTDIAQKLNEMGKRMGPMPKESDNATDAIAALTGGGKK